MTNWAKGKCKYLKDSGDRILQEDDGECRITEDACHYLKIYMPFGSKNFNEMYRCPCYNIPIESAKAIMSARLSKKVSQLERELR